MRVLGFFVLLVVISSCSVFNRHKEVLDDEQFAQVLADIHLADAVLVEKGYSIVNDSAKIKMYYRDIFKKNNISAAQFDTTLKYYTVHADKYDLVYDKVLEILSKRQQEIKVEAEKDVKINKVKQ